MGFPGGASGKEPACQCRRLSRFSQSLGQEDPTCWGATKPVSPNYAACALEPENHNY